jgi:D-alanyl-D-alanine carboxypeptidase
MSFYTYVIAKDARFKTKSIVSDVSLLEPITRMAVQNILEDAESHGVKYMVFETYRSKERQQQLFEQGATKLKAVGVHHYGLACDIVKSIGGKPSWKGDFTLLRDLAKHHGLIWGGDWGTPNQHHSFIDGVHVQRCSVGRQAGLFSGAWYPDPIYNPYQDL